MHSRLQFDKGGVLYDGLFDAVRKTHAADGLAGFWQGYTLNLTRTIPQCVVTFVAYEWLSAQLQQRLGSSSSGRLASSPSTGLGEGSAGGLLARTRSDSH